MAIQYDCYYAEYMIGPLPVDNATTTAVPLNYIYNGNGTLDSLDCSGDAPGGGGLTSPEELQGWTGDQIKGDDKAAPITILPDGPRHYFDPEENYVSWMDFTFFTTLGPAGLALYDIRFKGQRIIYELAMQEALAHYAGIQEDAAMTAYLDVSIGFTPGQLVPGYDCPSYATYTSDLTYCLFEYPKDYPMQRHTDDSFHVTRNIAFMARAVSTVGNYDYQITYEFYLDGSISVVARASGYIAWTDWTDDPLDPSYGFHIRPNNSGAMHDHVLNWKLDLDVHGVNNSLFKTEFVPVSRTYPWSNGSIINTMQVNRSFVETEDDSKINWAPNAAAAYIVVNKDKPNEFGEYPGYRIYPSVGSSIHSTIVDSTLLGNAVNWATHQLYATVRKDSEPSSTDILNVKNINNPPVDFNSFFNGESLTQQDLTLWFNLGMHHMPDTSDLPTTVFTNAQSGITIRPQNYLLSDASQATRQQVNVNMTNVADGGAAEVDYYGQKMAAGTEVLDQKMYEPDLAQVMVVASEAANGGS